MANALFILSFHHFSGALVVSFADRNISGDEHEQACISLLIGEAEAKEIHALYVPCLTQRGFLQGLAGLSSGKLS